MSNSLVVGISGGSGSGKTTIAREVVNILGVSSVTFLSQDSYYFDLSGCKKELLMGYNFDAIDAIDHDLFIANLETLRSGAAADVPIYSFQTHSRTGSVSVDPKPIILVEGLMIYNKKEVCDLFDLKIYIDIDSDIRFIRRLQRDLVERGRDVDSVVSQYLSTVREMHRLYVEPMKDIADFVISSDQTTSQIAMLISDRIRGL